MNNLQNCCSYYIVKTVSEGVRNLYYEMQYHLAGNIFKMLETKINRMKIFQICYLWEKRLSWNLCQESI